MKFSRSFHTQRTQSSSGRGSRNRAELGASMVEIAIISAALVVVLLFLTNLVVDLRQLNEDETAAYNAQALMGRNEVATYTAETGSINPDILNEILNGATYAADSASNLVTCGEVFELTDPVTCQPVVSIDLNDYFASYPPLNNCFRIFPDGGFDAVCNDAGPDGDIGTTADNLHDNPLPTVQECTNPVPIADQESTFDAALKMAQALEASGGCQQRKYIFCIQQAYYNPIAEEWVSTARCLPPTSVPEPPETPCLTKDTAVLMANGTYKPIDSLLVGEEVLSFDPFSAEPTLTTSEVTELYEAEGLTTFILFQVNGETVEATWNHGVYSVDQEKWVLALDLAEGSEVLLADGTVGVVESVRVESRFGIVYNLAVTSPHTYFVGYNNILVHNVGGDDYFPLIENPKKRTLQQSGRTTEPSSTASVSSKKNEWPSPAEWEKLSAHSSRPKAITTEGNPYNLLERIYGQIVPPFFSEPPCGSGGC